MTDDEFRALQELAHQVGEVVQHPGWEVLVDFVRFAPSGPSIALKQRELISGSIKSFEDYQRRVGWLDGAEFVIDANDRLQKMVKAEALSREERRSAEQE